jgi:DNA repair exonuclease SbcCD ATPase subunit
MILLRKIQLNNFLSHEKTEISFTDGEKALIDGASGAGKSALFDAILWCLYGQGRADNRSLVRKGAKKGSVCLELTSRRDDPGEETIIVTRSITTNGKHILEVAFEQPDGSRKPLPVSGLKELQAWIDKDLIGASYLLFVNSVAYVQGNTDSFVSQTAPKRKELLLEIVKAEDYGKYYDQARDALQELQNALNLASGRLAELNIHRDDLLGRLGDRVAPQAVLEDSRKTLEDLEPSISESEEKKASLLSAVKVTKVLDDALKTAQNDLDSAENELSRKAFVVSNKPQNLWITSRYPDMVGNIEKVAQKLDEMKKGVGSAIENDTKRDEFYSRKPSPIDRSEEIRRLEDESTFLKEHGPCPAGDKCPYYSKAASEMLTNMTKITELQTKTYNEGLALAKWSIEESSLPPEADMKTLMDEIHGIEIYLSHLKIQEEVSVMEKDVAEKRARMQNIMKKRENAGMLTSQEDINEVTAILELKYRKRDAYKEGIVRSQAALESIDSTEKEIKAVDERLKTIRNKDIPEICEKIRKVSLMKDAFGSKGIETIVIDYLLPKLEDRINDVLSKLSDFRVRLDTQRKSTDGENTIEGLFITILNEMGEEMPFESYSGGEKLKISVSISEALATLQHVGFRLFDETFLGLDENSTESFAGVLQDLQKNFNQVLCISHLLQIKELFDKKLFVTKNNNISYVAT